MVYQDKQLERESDSELLVLLAKGSQYAYTIIYNRYAPILYIHAERMLADKSEEIHIFISF